MQICYKFTPPTSILVGSAHSYAYFSLFAKTNGNKLTNEVKPSVYGTDLYTNIPVTAINTF